MDAAHLAKLMQEFVAVVDRPDLQTELPEQFPKHWDNQGKLCVVQIFMVRLVDLPCEMKLSLFFDGEEVVQTGILIKYKNQPLINEVRKGDFLDFQQNRRIDPIAFLKQNYGTTKPDEPAPPLAANGSYAMTVDDDAESEVFKAVQHLTGKNAEELRAYFDELLATNHRRPGKDQVSPIIKTWLKKERDRLDLLFLEEAHLLPATPRTEEITCFLVNEKKPNERTYYLVSKMLRGNLIRDKIDHIDPEWWGGKFYARYHDGLRLIPHDQHDRLLCLKSFHPAMEFPVEDILINGRHMYSVIFVGEEALVWRVKQHPVAESRQSASSAEVSGQGSPGSSGKIGKLMTRMGLKANATPNPSEQWESPDAPEPAKVHPFVVARSENNYVEALQSRAGDLEEKRRSYMAILFDSDPRRFLHQPEEMRIEMHGAIERALGNNRRALDAEALMLAVRVEEFYAEKQSARSS